MYSLRRLDVYVYESFFYTERFKNRPVDLYLTIIEFY